jgi:RNA polymerase sigma-70 factor, ECF subfamily
MAVEPPLPVVAVEPPLPVVAVEPPLPFVALEPPLPFAPPDELLEPPVAPLVAPVPPPAPLSGGTSGICPTQPPRSTAGARTAAKRIIRDPMLFISGPPLSVCRLCTGRPRKSGIQLGHRAYQLFLAHLSVQYRALTVSRHLFLWAGFMPDSTGCVAPSSGRTCETGSDDSSGRSGAGAAPKLRGLGVTPFGSRPPRNETPSHRAQIEAQMDDAILLAKVRAGDRAVADAFCLRVLPAVDRTVRRLLGRDDGEREDLIQIATVELVRSIGRFRGDSSLDTWASAVTARVVYKHIRGRPIERHLSIDLVEDESRRVSGPTGEGTFAVREVLSRVLRHMEAIGPKLAWAFVLHDVLGHALDEVAQILGISAAAAQSRLSRGRRRLQRRIAEDPELADVFLDPERIGYR